MESQKLWRQRAVPECPENKDAILRDASEVKDLRDPIEVRLVCDNFPLATLEF